jgi:uncharacterized circularly permuted ATP-grasp superfamily protein/uncharacterized alpha-E superfamily protein
VRKGTLPADQARDQEWQYDVPAGGHWDEALDPSGSVRPHWRRLSVALRRMGAAEFARRWQAGQQLIRANGITYNVYGDPQGQERPWLMDLLPLVVDGQEWDGIARAVTQRATLLNALLADIYGPRRLVRERWLPPELVLGNPSFLRPCAGVAPARGVHLHSYAVDLARAPSGQWWVIADRTQAPSGFGYALENRLVSARALPSLLDQCQVQSISRFFDVTLDALLTLASQRRDSPRIVLLTPGPHNETYFEHSYLARYWGFPLVSGADLTVRDDRVYLKTLAGLDPVDVIVRRMDDDFCDPLELRTDSVLGVPGLLQAVRAGNVVVANSLGSGVVETSSVMAFLPGLCRHVLGEDLLMPSVATWWCGDAEPKRRVLDNLEHVVIKPTFPRFGLRPQFPAVMSADERRALAARIEAAPERYVAQEQIDLSTAPVHPARGLEARHVVMRVLAAWDGTSYAVLPGGLTRVSRGDRSLVVSMQLGGGSKDTWIVGSRERGQAETAAALAALQPGNSTTELPSRVADNLFWLGRYTERLDAHARLLRALLPGMSGESHLGRRIAVDTTLHFLRAMDLVPLDWGTLGSSVSRGGGRLAVRRLLGQAVFDPGKTASLGWNLDQIRRVSWETKEQLSPDAWRVLQRLEADAPGAQDVSADRTFMAATAHLDGIVMMLAAFGGLLIEHPTRGHGWRFLDIGRRMERALQMIELIRAGVDAPPALTDACLEVLLHVTDSSTAYRSRYLTSIRASFVLELLLADEANPRSVAYQLATLDERVKALCAMGMPGYGSLETSLTSRLLVRRRDVAVEELAGETPRHRAALVEHLDALKEDLLELSDALTARYLSHLSPTRMRSSS